jgi:hypothetical protein
VFAAIYTAGLPLAFGPLAGAGLGVLLGIEYGVRRGETAGFIFAVLRGAAFGLAGTLLYRARFGEVLGGSTAIGLLAAYRARFSVARDYPNAPQPFVRLDVIKAQAVRASVAATAAIVASVAAGLDEPAGGLFALRLGLVSWIAGTTVGHAAPFVERFADQVSPRRLGAIGAVLILGGLLLQSLQYWVVVLNMQLRP